MRLVMLSGGVGGARMARGLAALPRLETTVVVNVADDDNVHGLHVSPDLDTVVYTLAGMEGDQGWGRSGETWRVMDELDRFPIDTSFRLGDADLATNLFRTDRLAAGWTLSEVTREVCRVFGVETPVLPASDDPVRTMLRVEETGEWLDFQTYFVRRRHSDRIDRVRFDGAETARPAEGVVEAITSADAVLLGPSNPILSIHPILAVSGIEAALKEARRVVAVSPLIRGRALKGPAAELLAAFGYPPGNQGVLAAYGGLVTHLVVDGDDAEDRSRLEVEVLATDTRITRPDAAARLADELVTWLS